MACAARHDGATPVEGARARPHTGMALERHEMRVMMVAVLGCATVLGWDLAAQSPDPVTALIEGATVQPVVDGVAMVGTGNTRRDPGTGFIDVLLEPDPTSRSRLIVDPDATDVVAGILRRLDATGAAAGLSGVLYDNRDSGHSALPQARFPQLAHTSYDDVLRQQRLHHGVAGRVRFALPVVGNSSTALKGPIARSLGRLAVIDQAAALRSYRLFVSNHLYVYPEHRDYDPATGDRLLANVPYFVLSQGSSGSDMPFVRTALEIIAALTPETRAEAEASGRLPATVQAVMRRTMEGVNSDAHYLSPVAHPPVFAKSVLRPALAVRYANALTPAALPPLVALAVERDFAARPGLDYLAENLGEVLFTTPMAVARAWRSFVHDRRITLRATVGPLPEDADTPRFHWLLLQGDPARVTITPRGDPGDVVDIDIAWHDRFPVAPGGLMQTPRVDIAVVADAGGAVSVPAVFSVLFPTHQARTYRPGPAGALVLESLSYGRPDARDDYADPLVWPAADWRDALVRDARGRVIALERTRPDGTREVLRRTASGWDQGGLTVRHSARAGRQGALDLDAAVIGSDTQ